jgi:hypothetical protein
MLTVLTALLALPVMPGARADVLYSPIVEDGEKAVEWRSTVRSNGEEEHKLELEISPTPWWRAELLTTADREPGAARQWTEVSFENVFSLNPQGRDFLDLGALVELSHGLPRGSGFGLEVGLLAEHSTPRTVVTVNVSAERELTAGADTDLVLAARWRWRRGPRFEPGIEYHADLGSIGHMPSLEAQRHSLGPAAVGRFAMPGGILRYEAAFVIGLTHGTPASTARVQLEWEFH